MTIEGIIRMAKQAGFADEEIDTCQQMLIHFAELITEHEREACAKVCEEYLGYGTRTEFAATIRARGQV
jgi:hypothetical protein